MSDAPNPELNPPANPSADNEAPDGRRRAGAVDPGTGELYSVPRGPERPDASHTGRGHAIDGERTIPSVNRERTIQSRISSFVAIGTMLLLGAGFLFWYYSTQYAKGREARLAAQKASAARAGGETKVPPLGRIDPPPTPPQAPAPPPSASPAAAAATPQGGPPPKTPAQLALERKLGTPVMRHAPSPDAAAATAAFAGGPAGPAASSVPNMAQILGALQPPPSSPSSPPGLEGSLRPTRTPAVTAQVLPTRRFLLPKGAFIDCTLETAIDSTYEGLTTCIGASDIYSADGKVVLLERGTKYVGEQRGSPRQGQGRVFVLWSEARTPTGVVVQLASPGTDEMGRNGLPGFVDTHFWERFGAAMLLSVIDGTMQALTARQQGGAGLTNRGALVIGPQGSRDILTEVLRSTIAIPPTVIKNQGERIQILVARDVDFRDVYALRVAPAQP
ncbi:type IV secretion system protein VirB10 [Variovorax sp. DAIF25]|uniref:type IV secretion system protein VirB10 n=1 Tax=Variovorax sp. DAIF25 TaxID=3080983 RepID=UPI003D6B6359